MVTISTGFLDEMNPFGYTPPATTGGQWSAPSPAPTAENPFGAVAPWETGGQYTAPSYAPPPAPVYTPPQPAYVPPAPTWAPTAPVQGPVNPYNYTPYEAPIGPANPAMGDPMMYDAPIGPGLAQPSYNLDTTFSIPQGGFGAQQELDAIPKWRGGAPGLLDIGAETLGNVRESFTQDWRASDVPFLPFVKDGGFDSEAGGEFMEAINRPALPERITSEMPNPWWFPAKTLTENITSPGGYLSILPFAAASKAGLGIGLAREGLEEAGAAYGSRIASEFTDNPYIIGAAGLGGGITAAVGPEMARPIARGVGAAGDVITDIPSTAARTIGTPDLPPAGAIDPSTGMPFARVTPGGAGQEVLGPRVGPLQAGDVVVGPGGVDYTVRADTTGGSQSFVRVVDRAGEERRIRRTMLRPVETEPPAGAIEPPAPPRAATEAPTPIRPAAGVEPPRPPDVPARPVVATPDDARRQLLDALREEDNIRRVGTADREIAQGRRTQARGISDQFGAAAASGLSPEEIARQARSGAAVGKLRQTTAGPVNVTPEARAALFEELNVTFRDGGMSQFDYLRNTLALKKALDGDGLQPAELRALRLTFGDEVADTLAKRPKSAAQVLRDEQAEVARIRETETKIAEKARREAAAAEARANRLRVSQVESADRPALRNRWRTIAEEGDPETIKREIRRTMTPEERKVALAELERAADTRQRDAGTLTDRVLREAAERDAANKRQIADELRRESEVLRRQSRTEMAVQKQVELERQRSIRAFNRADEAEIRETRRYNEMMEARQQRDAAKQVGRLGTAEQRAMEAADLKAPNPEMVIKKAEEWLGESYPEMSALRQDQLETVRLWLEATRQVVDGIGDTRFDQLAALRAMGDIPDSYLSTLYARAGHLTRALEMQGLDTPTARKVTKELMAAEIVRRYGNAPDGVPYGGSRARIPAHIKAMLDETVDDPTRHGLAKAGGDVSQLIKNTQFGLGDLAVFGQQGLKAVGTGWAAMTAGAINRTLAVMHLPHVMTNLPESSLPTRLQYQLDGVAQGVSTGISDFTRGQGTLIGSIPGIGKVLDPYVIRATDKMNDLQFGLILGNLRNLVYEGNLVLLRGAGQDILDPRVRATAAEIANSATSAGRLAQTITRRDIERAFLLSPSMRRAQVQQITQVAKGLSPAASASERILAAVTITTAAASVLAVGKLVNDYFGVGEFEFDPSKPGFGNVTFPGGVVVNFFPQEQVVRYVSQAARLLAEGDPKEAGLALAKLGLSSASPAAQIFNRSIGIGFDPERGYRWGDLNDGTSLGERVFRALPLPPIVQNTVQEGLDAIRTPLDLFGVNNYEETIWSRLHRIGDGDFFALSKEEQARRLAANPAVAEEWKRYQDTQTAESQRSVSEVGRPLGFETLRQIDEQATGRLTALATDFEAGKFTGNEVAFRNALSDIWADRREQKALISDAFQLFKDTGKLPSDPLKAAEAQFFDLVGDDSWRDVATGKIADYDAYEEAIQQFKAGLTPEQRAHIESFDNRDRNLPAPIQAYYDTLDAIGESGFYDTETGRLKFLREHPDVVPMLEKYGLSRDSTRVYREEERYRNEQAASDARLASGALTPEQWREDLDRRMSQLSGAKEMAYAGITTQGEKTALDNWYAAIDQSTLADGTVDWDKVSAWEAQQPPDVQRLIAERERFTLSPKAAEFNADKRVIAASGYWDVTDRVYERWATASGLQWPGSTDALMAETRQAISQRLADRGITGEGAMALTQQVMNEMFKVPADLASQVRKAVRDENRELQTLLIRWGYWSPGKADTAEYIVGGR